MVGLYGDRRSLRWVHGGPSKRAELGEDPMTDLECLACGHTLKDMTHHVEAFRDEGHKTMPLKSNSRYDKGAVDLPTSRAGGALTGTPWAVRWDDE